MKKRVKKITGLRKIARAHAVFFLISFGLYTALSAILTPSFILSDMRNKSKALADDTITLVAKVLAPPVEPIVSGEAVCTNGNLSIQLNWPTDENSTSFDIDRDGSPLITSLIESQYADSNVVVSASYTYTVTARGPMGPGSAVSKPIAIKTPDECKGSTLVYYEKITAIESKNIASLEDVPQITVQKPTFSGHTNIPYAKIFITLHSGPEITAITYANGNGYWSWTSPETLDLGSHTIETIAVDPNDSTITATDSFSFEIVEKTTSQTNANSHKKKEIKKTNLAQRPTPAIITTAPFEIAVSVRNPDQIVYAGNNLSFNVDFIKKSPTLANQDYKIFYDVIDSDGRTVSEIYENINPTQIDSLEKNILIPILTKAGKYKIIVKAYDGRNLIEGEDFFQVKELPVVSVGSTSISLTQIMQSLGWISLLLFLLFLILLGIEHHQSEGALIQITENYLRRHGFLTKRKGVQR